MRTKFFFIRKKNYFEIKPNFFNPLINLIKQKYNNKIINLSSYYPASYEVNVLKFFELNIINNLKILLPAIKKNNLMFFYKWKKNDILQINRFGMLEPALLISKTVPDIMLIPLLSYDNYNNRLGYGGGFYDRYIDRIEKIKKVIKIGLAFSYQKVKTIPINQYDKKLDFIITEKEILK